MYILVRTLHLR